MAYTIQEIMITNMNRTLQLIKSQCGYLGMVRVVAPSLIVAQLHSWKNRRLRQTPKDRGGSVVLWCALRNSTEVRRPCILCNNTSEIGSKLEGKLSRMLPYFGFADHPILQALMKATAAALYHI